MPNGRVILGGYGGVGHVVAALLHHSGVPFIAFDNDPVKVAKGKEEGFPVFYGDIADPELLAVAHAEQASVVVLTIIGKEGTTLQAVLHVRNNYPGVAVIARASDLEASGRLLQAGATLALPEALESSLRLAADTLRLIGVPADDVDLLISNVRTCGYEPVCFQDREGKQTPPDHKE